MPRPAHTPDQKRAIRNQIRAAAARLYKQDAGKVSVRAVAAEAGVSVGTVYSHFDSLSTLLQSLWREPIRALVNQMELLCSEVNCPKQQLKALLHAYVEFAQSQESVFRNSLLFVRPESMPAPPQVDLERDRFFQLFRSAIREGQQTGQFRQGNLDDLTQALISAVHGGIALPINFHRLALDASTKIPNLVITAMLEWLEMTEAG